MVLTLLFRSVTMPFHPSQRAFPLGRGAMPSLVTSEHLKTASTSAGHRPLHHHRVRFAGREAIFGGSVRFWMQNLDRVLGCTITLPALPDSLGAMALFGAAIPDDGDFVFEHPCMTRRVRVSGGDFVDLPRPEKNFHRHTRHGFEVVWS